MKITVRQKTDGMSRWQTIVDAEIDRGRSIAVAQRSATETDDFRFQFLPRSEATPAIRISVGTMLVASTIAADRVFAIKDDGGSDLDPPPLVCSEKLLANWMGITELTVDVRWSDEDDWTRAATIPLSVKAGKLHPELFDLLIKELERDTAALLLDVYGKTQLGLKRGEAIADSAPIAILRRLKSTIREFESILRHIGKNPACRLRTIRTRELALIGQAVTEATLEEACADPGILRRHAGRLIVREHLHELSHPDYRIPEHQVIADFAEYLKFQLADLRGRIDLEIKERRDRKTWRHFPREGGLRSWWEEEDLPRIEILGEHRDDVARLRHLVDSWSNFPFLPRGTALKAYPSSTALFRKHPTYRRLYQIIEEHFRAFRISLDNQSILMRARSLPVLYEWWCAVRVVRTLSRGLTPVAGDPSESSLVRMNLAREGKQFTIEFSADQVLTFVDDRGGRVRFRYQPRYRAARDADRSAIGLLGEGNLRTPDMALEIFPPGTSPADSPSLIVVLDAKYSSSTQSTKATEVRSKYSLIGDVKKGTVLSRQVWALTPAAPSDPTPHDGLRGNCTVDNDGFWSDAFSMSNPVHGAVQCRPVVSGDFDPLDALLIVLLERSGLRFFVPSRDAAEHVVPTTDRPRIG